VDSGCRRRQDATISLRTESVMPMKAFNKITGANAGGPRRLPMRTRWAARVAQFGR
jgi:hypothetical protein